MHKAAHLAAYALSHILAGRLHESVVQQSALKHEPKPRLSPRQSRKARKAEQRAQAQIEVRQAYLNDMRHLQRRREILENE